MKLSIAGVKPVFINCVLLSWEYITDNFIVLRHAISMFLIMALFLTSAKAQQLSLIAMAALLLRNMLADIQQKTTNKGPLVLVWMMATLEPIPATYGHRAWLRAHKCYSLWTLCQPMASWINGQFRAGMPTTLHGRSAEGTETEEHTTHTGL